MIDVSTASLDRQAMRHVGAVFEDQDVQLDGNEFIDCVFRRSRLVFFGIRPVELSGNVIEECDWIFEGPAVSTLSFMSGLYNGAGEDGRNLIEKTFDQVRGGGGEPFQGEEQKIAYKPHIFIGHGGSADYALLKNHLTDRGYEVENFESGPRAGHSAKDVVEGMARRAAMAFLVHTAEDEQDGAKVRARQNVVHETGLFQGRLGFARAIVLREEGCEEFSNLAGIQYIAFRKGHIKDTFGEVIDTIEREFPSAR